MNPQIAVIGYGRFGRLLAHHLGKFSTVCVFDKRGIRNIEPGIARANLRRAAACPVIIIAVPIGELRALLRSMGPLVNPGALVIDVCSVKEEPLRWMREYLPQSVWILGSHPLFGPSSASLGVRGKSIVLCNVRMSRTLLTTVHKQLNRAGIKIIPMTPSAHDRWIARTLFLTQVIGRAAAGIIKNVEGLPTAAYGHLLGLTKIATADSARLVCDIYAYNRHARSVCRALEQSLKTLSQTRKNQRFEKST